MPVSLFAAIPWKVEPMSPKSRYATEEKKPPRPQRFPAGRSLGCTEVARVSTASGPVTYWFAGSKPPAAPGPPGAPAARGRPTQPVPLVAALTAQLRGRLLLRSTTGLSDPLPLGADQVDARRRAASSQDQQRQAGDHQTHPVHEKIFRAQARPARATSLQWGRTQGSEMTPRGVIEWRGPGGSDAAGRDQRRVSGTPPVPSTSIDAWDRHEERNRRMMKADRGEGSVPGHESSARPSSISCTTNRRRSERNPAASLSSASPSLVTNRWRRAVKPAATSMRHQQGSPHCPPAAE